VTPDDFPGWDEDRAAACRAQQLHHENAPADEVLIAATEYGLDESDAAAPQDFTLGQYRNGYDEEISLDHGRLKVVRKPIETDPSVPEVSKAEGLGEWNAAGDVEPPPPRGWLLGNSFCRGFISSLIGDGGVGKTALRYLQYLALATNCPFTGEHVFQRSRVLIVSLEDDADELRRRVLAARLHYNIPLSELDGWLFLAAPGAAAGKLKSMNEKGQIIDGQLKARLEAAIAGHRIDLVALDPFVKSHSIDENANMAIDTVAQLLSDLAANTTSPLTCPIIFQREPESPATRIGLGARVL